MDNYWTFIQNPINEKKKIALQIDEINQKLSTARNKLLSEIIDDEEYLENKNECKLRIENLEEELNQSEECPISSITNIVELYTTSGIKIKREIIGSIFPEKL